MKNIILGLVMIFTLNSFSIENDPPLVRSWWKTVLVDAAGALGGAGSVASISGYLSTTNPLGWGAMGAGAAVGAAGASLAMVVPPSGTISVEALNLDFTFAKNSSNEDDNIGNEHNNIIIGFAKSGRNFTVKNYLEYIKGLNNNAYIKALSVINSEYLAAEFNTVRGLTDETAVLDLIKNRLPNGVEKEVFLSDLLAAMDVRTSREFVSKIKVMELKYSNDSNIDSIDKLQLNSFFSTLRYSATLWMD